MVVNTWKDYKESHKNLIMCRRFRYISMILLSTLHFSFCDKNCVVVIVDVVVLFAIIIFFCWLFYHRKTWDSSTSRTFSLALSIEDRQSSKWRTSTCLWLYCWFSVLRFSHVLCNFWRLYFSLFTTVSQGIVTGHKTAVLFCYFKRKSIWYLLIIGCINSWSTLVICHT